jgi:hypothetical protein
MKKKLPIYNTIDIDKHDGIDYRVKDTSICKHKIKWCGETLTYECEICGKNLNFK